MGLNHRKEIATNVECNEVAAKSRMRAAENRNQLNGGKAVRPNGGHGKQSTSRARAFAAVDSQALRRNKRRYERLRNNRQDVCRL
jgi:hypothetical protein